MARRGSGAAGFSSSQYGKALVLPTLYLLIKPRNSSHYCRKWWSDLLTEYLPKVESRNLGSWSICRLEQAKMPHLPHHGEAGEFSHRPLLDVAHHVFTTYEAFWMIEWSKLLTTTAFRFTWCARKLIVGFTWAPIQDTLNMWGITKEIT
jgi:hypothetical protein